MKRSVWNKQNQEQNEKKIVCEQVAIDFIHISSTNATHSDKKPYCLHSLWDAMGMPCRLRPTGQ